MTQLTTLYDNILGFISDHLLDDIWAGLYARQYRAAAAGLAFNLAFNSELTADEQATVASRRRAVRA
jgi:hypothetical protein